MTEKNDKKKVISLIVLCVSLVALTTSLTYAYFVSQVGTNEQEKITIRSGDLALTFRDNDETVENTEGTWNFGDSIEKELVIENTGTRDAYAKISWDNLINTYLAESLTYTLEEKSDDSGAVWKQVETVSVNVPRSENVSTQLLADHLLVPAGHTYTYRVRITFEDLLDIDQTADLNAKFITKFTLDEGVKEGLYDKIKRTAQTTIPNFVIPATTDETADGLFSMEDDYGTSYYYRGTAPNNYIKFGQNAEGQDMWWRIIRFNGDGTVRMQYDGIGAEGSDTYTKGFALTNPWNSNNNDAKFVGWMFGGTNKSASVSREQAQRNETDSEIKTKVDEWYKTNIVDTGYSRYVADSIFCNDRSFESRNTGVGYGNNTTTYYGARGRTGVNLGSTTPQFTCSQENDKFTVESENGGNGALTYPIGLITADEIVTAGSGKYNTVNGSYYLNKGDWYWSFSPHDIIPTGHAYVFSIYGSGVLNSYAVHNSGAVAPVINIKAEYLDKLQGNGTIDNPYFLQ